MTVWLTELNPNGKLEKNLFEIMTCNDAIPLLHVKHVSKTFTKPVSTATLN